MRFGNGHKIAIPDRYWWLRPPGAAALFIVAPVAAVWFALSYPWATLSDPDFRTEALVTLACYFGLVLYMLTQAVQLVRSVEPALSRYRRRVAAPTGDREAIPRAAAIPVDAAAAPSLDGGAIELLTRTTVGGRRVYSALLAFGVLVFGSLVVIGIILLMVAFQSPPVRVFPTDPFLIAVLLGLALLLVGICFVLPIALIAFMTRMLWKAVRGLPQGVVADAEGILWYPQVGRSQAIPWSAMRLLAVALMSTSSSSSTRTRPHTYRLYGSEVVAEWSDATPDWVTTMGITPEELKERQQALLDLIAARTGLVPRTFDASLQRGEPATAAHRASQRSSQFVGAGCMVVLALVWVGFAAALLLVPLSSSGLLNQLAAGAMLVGPAFGTAEMGVQVLARRRRRSPTDMPDLANDDGLTAYALVRRQSLPLRMVSLVIGLVLLLDFLPALMLWFPGTPQQLLGLDASVTNGFGVVASYILLGFAVAGVFAIPRAIRSAPTEFRADADGLSEWRGDRERRRLTWDAIVELQTWALGITVYQASDLGRQHSIVWNDALSDTLGAATGGMVQVSAAQLARIVARRAGVPLETQTNFDLVN